MILQQPTDLSYLPKRIISLVPSQTELLAHLGLEAETIGITRFCVHPERWFNVKERIGGTKKLNIDRIKSLKPDLIIANKEENVKEQVEELALYYPVWLTDVNNLDEALQMIRDVGNLTGKNKEAKALRVSINKNFDGLQKSKTPNSKFKTAYFIWQKPYMTVGGDTFINNMLMQCGFENIFSDKQRYPVLSIEELQKTSCQLLLLSSEPYPFKQKHIDELSKKLPDTKILLVDGEFFSWYGSRLLKAPVYFEKLLQNINQLK